jgi:hypothetical protein
MIEVIDEHKELLDRFPFLSLCKHGSGEYVGIVQNQSAAVCSVYVYSQLKDTTEKENFLELGEEWWVESNRMIPINIVLKSRFEKFQYCLKTFNAKDFEVLYGPSISLANILKKRIKRRQIQLVRKVD